MRLASAHGSFGDPQRCVELLEGELPTPPEVADQRSWILLAKTYWDRYTLFDITYRPKLMSVAELEEGLRWLFVETYSKQATREHQRGFARARRAGEHP